MNPLTTGPLRRKTEIKRSPMPPRTKPMNRQGKKTRQRKAAHAPTRTIWLARFSLCMWCRKPMYGDGPNTPTTHEIYGGTSQRQKTFTMPALWLALHAKCNQALPSIPDEALFVRQLALKLIHDEPHFDITEANKIWTRNGAEPVTISQVRDELDYLENG